MCVRAPLSAGLWLLLEHIVDQDLKEDEETDDDVVALLEEGATLHPAHCTTPQDADAPANTHRTSEVKRQVNENNKKIHYIH